MCALWKLPCLFVCENNLYGMGTSTDRAAHNTKFYTRGDSIPGIQTDGMDVFAVRETFKWAKEWCVAGKGPLFIELNTYRYHGHSMSDPGVSYRSRDEISNVRKMRDPITVLKKFAIENKLADEAEIKVLEKQAKKIVEEAVQQAMNDPFPPAEELFRDIYADAGNFIRDVEVENSLYSVKSEK